MPHGWSYNLYTGSYAPHWSYVEYLFVFHPKLILTTILKNSKGQLSVTCCTSQTDYHKGRSSFCFLPFINNRTTTGWETTLVWVAYSMVYTCDVYRTQNNILKISWCHWFSSPAFYFSPTGLDTNYFSSVFIIHVRMHLHSIDGIYLISITTKSW